MDAEQFCEQDCHFVAIYKILHAGSDRSMKDIHKGTKGNIITTNK